MKSWVVRVRNERGAQSLLSSFGLGGKRLYGWHER
jgi:hypothetical protein